MSFSFSWYPFLLELQNNNTNDILCLKLLPRVVLLYTIDQEINRHKNHLLEFEDFPNIKISSHI